MAHLTHSQRTSIEAGLRNQDSFKEIARNIEKSPFKEEFCRKNDTPNVVEMDSVIGRRGGKVLLTMNFNNCTFLLAFIRNSNNSQSVIDIFDHLEQSFGTATFKKLFPDFTFE